MRWTDGSIGYLLEWLAHFGHLENTLIVLASDHGEAFLERGYEGHAREVYRESTEVPLLLSFPFRLEPGIVVKTPCAMCWCAFLPHPIFATARSRAMQTIRSIHCLNTRSQADSVTSCGPANRTSNCSRPPIDRNRLAAYGRPLPLSL